jgi:dihydropteroate synthase
MFTLNCKGRLLVLERPVVMGILNVTPDSFYAGSRINSEQELLEQAGRMIEEGAVILDVGGQSSRPGAVAISADEETKRVVPAIAAIRKSFPDVYISVDTFYADVAKASAHAGADMINDISGGLLDPRMLETVSILQIPYIGMHMRGTPATMQQETSYKDLITDLLDYFQERIQTYKQAGIHDMIIDPGFGFSKTISQNFELLNALNAFQIFQVPVLVGLSRKSMIYKTLGCSPEEALNGTTVLQTIALQKGASILRTHDVKAAVECIALVSCLSK